MAETGRSSTVLPLGVWNGMGSVSFGWWQHVSHSGQGFVCLTYNSVLFSFINYICLRFSKRFILKIVAECQHECATDREGRTLGTLPSLCSARPSAPTCAVSSHAPWHPHTCAVKGIPPTVGLWFQLSCSLLCDTLEQMQPNKSSFAKD